MINFNIEYSYLQKDISSLNISKLQDTHSCYVMIKRTEKD